MIPLGQKQTKLITEEQKSQCYFYNSDLTSDKKIIKMETGFSMRDTKTF